jgi:hypothetical protein
MIANVCRKYYLATIYVHELSFQERYSVWSQEPSLSGNSLARLKIETIKMNPLERENPKQVMESNDNDIVLLPSASAEVILLETEVKTEPLFHPEPIESGPLGQWFSALKDIYRQSSRTERLILATAFSVVGIVIALAGAAYFLPATPIGMALAQGLAPLPLVLVCLWLIILSQK